MAKEMRDPNEPVGKMFRVKDFLPPPGRLVLPDEKTVKVTISLKKSSVEFFKNHAERHHTKYQKMIRELLDKYTTHYSSV
ncbi:MAG: CopG family transcriptional regulator [Candidatus Omnitrophota bacterium]